MAPWTAPERVDPPYLSAERNGLESWLEYQRATLVTKCAGLAPDQLCERSCPPSTMSLLGLVRHLADVERYWFRRVLAGEDVPHLFYAPGWGDDDAFDGVSPAAADADLAAYTREVETVRAVASRHALDDVGHRGVDAVPLRWIYTHLSSEYARHNGHADLLRERVDGATGE